MEDQGSPLDFERSPLSSSAAEPGLRSEPPPLSGVDGDIKQAFGDRATGRNLRDDLLLAADNVTSAMSSLVKELNSGMYVLRGYREVSQLCNALVPFLTVVVNVVVNWLEKLVTLLRWYVTYLLDNVQMVSEEIACYQIDNIYLWFEGKRGQPNLDPCSQASKEISMPLNERGWLRKEIVNNKSKQVVEIEITLTTIWLKKIDMFSMVSSIILKIVLIQLSRE